MKAICIYFQVHQPNRLKPYTFFELGQDHFYENDPLNREILERVSHKCYLPANELMLRLIDKHKGEFKITYSLSGVIIEQLEKYRPDVLKSFVELANTGCVEFLSETYYHSLSYVYSKDEFKRQVNLHQEKIESLFGVSPKVFRNTELIYYNELANLVEQLGYKGILAEGVNSILRGRTPNQIYHPPDHPDIGVLLRNYQLSDDIAFRFSDKEWLSYPLTSNKYTDWLGTTEGEIVNIFMDYETIGEHHWKDTGIFDFWERFPSEALSCGHNFKTPSKVIKDFKASEPYDAFHPISWADSERDLSAWRGNAMQHEALDKVYELEPYIKKSHDKSLLEKWARLQTSDHFYYMSTKHDQDGEVHNYFNPYQTPYDGYIYYMNALSDMEISLEKEGIKV